MHVGRARKAGRDLVRQLTGEPERTGAVEELLQLCVDVPEARRTAKASPSAQRMSSLVATLDCCRGLDVCPPRRVRIDCFRRRELGNTT